MSIKMTFIFLFNTNCCNIHIYIVSNNDKPVFMNYNWANIINFLLLPSFVSPILLFKVPKKLLQEQETEPSVYSAPPSAHDPNIVGDSPPEGSPVRRPDAVPGERNGKLVTSCFLVHNDDVCTSSECVI